MTSVYRGSEPDQIVDGMIANMKFQIENPALLNSRFVFDEFLYLDINFHQLNLMRGTRGGNSWYFRTGVCHYKISISTLSGIFVPNGGLQSTILMAVLGKNGFHLKKISKKCGFFVQTRSKKSISSVFFWFAICVIKITDPIWNFLQIL